MIFQIFLPIPLHVCLFTIPTKAGKKVLLVSYHAPHQKLTDTQKEKNFRQFLLFIADAMKETASDCLICGVDSNLVHLVSFHLSFLSLVYSTRQLLQIDVSSSSNIFSTLYIRFYGFN